MAAARACVTGGPPGPAACPGPLGPDIRFFPSSASRLREYRGGLDVEGVGGPAGRISVDGKAAPGYVRALGGGGKGAA